MRATALARVGRKRNGKGKIPPPAKRQRGTKEDDRGTPELARHRAEVVKLEDVRRQEAGDELGILMLNGVISQNQRMAGIKYARLRNAVCGSPHCAISGYGERWERGKATDASAKNERSWRRCVDALRTLPPEAKIELDSVAVFNCRPDWLWDDRRKALFIMALSKLVWLDSKAALI